MELTYKNITISGKIAVGTTTLAKNLSKIIRWKHINAGFIQREYDRLHNIHENMQGAAARSDSHENEIDAMTRTMLTEKKHLVYEAWLSGFMAKGIPHILKILMICSEESIRVDRVVNRENISVEEAKLWMRRREEENITKWKKLYGNHDFWDPKYYDLVIDTYSSGRIETLGKVLDKLGFPHDILSTIQV